jgi:TIR domain
VAADTSSAFVSYSRVDSEFAMQLAEHLKAAGANVWLDQLDIEPGTPWDSAIEEALLKSSHMLVVLSTVSVTSDNVRDEVSYALSQQMKVIPVLYRECKVPFRLARLQHIDFRNDYDSAFKALLKTLRVEQQLVPSTAATPSFEDNAVLADAAQAQRRNEEDRLQAQRAEHLAQQAQWEEERQQQLAQRAEWEEEQRLRDQAEAARQAESARQAEISRQTEATRIAAEAERQRAAAILAEQTRRQQQEAIELARKNAPATKTPSVWNSPQPQPQTNTSTPSPLGQIVKYAVVAGLLRAICSFASAFLARLFGYRLSNLISAILIGAITGLVLYRVLLLFKPELSKKQVRPIFWVWVAAGIALAAINLGIEWISTYGILVFVPPTLIAGAITGRILARALCARSKGIIIGIVSFAIPAFSIQILSRVLIPGLPISYEEFGIVTLILSFCVAAIEVGLLLWFIRNWGRPRTSQAS